MEIGGVEISNKAHKKITEQLDGLDLTGLIPAIKWTQTKSTDMVIEGWQIIFQPRPSKNVNNIHTINGLDILVSLNKFKPSETRGLKIDYVKGSFVFEEK